MDVTHIESIDLNWTDIRQWCPTIEQTRDACLEGRIIALNMPVVAPNYWIRRDELEGLLPKIHDAVRQGRLIDCGNLPNEVIKIGGKRGGMMYHNGLLAHPFTQPWVLYHTWEEGVSVYLVELQDADPAGGTTEITELNPMLFKDRKIISIGDRVWLDRPDRLLPPERYQGRSRPSTWRLAYAGEASAMQVAGAAMANCLDPFVTALLLLHTDGVPVNRIDPPVKLNKARLKVGKLPLPSLLRIDSAPYVTALLTRRQRRRGAPQGGTHASPIFHWRMGHWRYFQDGRQPATAQPVTGERGPWRIRIRDAVVNAKGEARDAFLRSHYDAKR